MSNIPRARAVLSTIKKDFILRPAITRRLNKALGLLNREKSVRMVHGTRAKMTTVLGVKVRAWKVMHPGWTQQRIAEKFNLTNARVSEALTRKKWY